MESVRFTQLEQRLAQVEEETAMATIKRIALGTILALSLVGAGSAVSMVFISHKLSKVMQS